MSTQSLPADLKGVRNSILFLNEVYFWTDTIKDWKCLLRQDKYKQVIIEELQWLVERKLVVVYGFVIMPNHLHLIWEMRAKNGKEMPYASFNKWTSSRFLTDLRTNHPQVLPHFVVDEKERAHRFWQRDALAVLMDSRKKVEQKLTYIHLNPLHVRWNLADQPENYRWSSAKFYGTGEDEFGILTHYMERFLYRFLSFLIPFSLTFLLRLTTPASSPDRPERVRLNAAAWCGNSSGPSGDGPGWVVGTDRGVCVFAHSLAQEGMGRCRI